MAHNLMTIPKEIRLRVLELVAEGVFPEIRYHLLEEPSPSPYLGTYAARLSLEHPVPSNGFSKRVVSRATYVSGQYRIFPETTFHLACRLLRTEFYQTLGATKILDLTGYSALAGFATIGCKPETLDMGQILPADYANHVKHIRFGLGTLQEAHAELLQKALTKVFPALTDLSIKTPGLEPELSELPSWQDVIAKGLADYAPPEAIVRSVRQSVVNYVESLELRSDRRFRLALTFTAADANLVCDDCFYDSDAFAIFRGTANEKTDGTFNIKLRVSVDYYDYVKCCAAGHDASARLVY